MGTDFTSILKWYSGKGLGIARDYILPTLAEAEALEYWPKGASRKVKAALNKMNVAKKFIVKHVGSYSGSRYDHPYYVAWSPMYFGTFAQAHEVLAKIPKPSTPAEHVIEATVREWCTDFAPLADLVEKLDATRPKPVYVFKTLSPTVVANVGTAIGIKLDTIRSPEIVWIKVTKKDKKGNEYSCWVPDIKWPANTTHNASRFAYGSAAGNSQCEACGHAIKNPWNWVPLLADVDGRPHSLWVGKDCASKLFGCKVDGEAEFRSVDDFGDLSATSRRDLAPSKGAA